MKREKAKLNTIINGIYLVSTNELHDQKVARDEEIAILQTQSKNTR